MLKMMVMKMASLQNLSRAARRAPWARVPCAGIASSRVVQDRKTAGYSREGARTLYMKKDTPIGKMVADMRDALKFNASINLLATGTAIPGAIRSALVLEYQGLAEKPQMTIGFSRRPTTGDDPTPASDNRPHYGTESVTLTVIRAKEFFDRHRERELRILQRLEDEAKAKAQA
ncbi:hypothetical protein FVE85_0468 [Porphyridium purpureum]|uniref:DNA/RNA-binding protein Alba-like domain-containing protein n=1 Tax=Porphyridium purpureum TaxID=35688 RepID=A0A5J4YYQ0_PORPP|nr:hypothetical protein FVE85_0468 [Porphyridium purpureum]|eukprot:POR2985..scf208_2